MITDDKVIEIFFIIDEFCKEFEQEMSKLSEAFTSNTQSNFLFGSNLIPNWGNK